MEQGRQPAAARSRKVVLRAYIDRAPREDDMELVDGGDVALRVPEGAGPAVLVKNLYLSCDPYMRGRMRDFHGSYIPPFKPGSAIEGFGLCRVVDSTHPGFSAGDIVSGMTGWEDYSLITKPEHIGSLGKQQGMAMEVVQNVTVKTAWFTGTTNGLRIKTWGGPKRGVVRDVTFMDATMAGVENPIIIDQNYCPNDAGCPSSRSSSIKITDVSRSSPCSGISLQDVALTYRNRVAKSYCRNVQGTQLGLVLPQGCL
ncbi:hypothetical protein PR202_ga08669 [Eleusine coracana subsp. coracana]|uniref:Oxidoreductase N-terminal domain-containing protein n=1 Tax=Eleusine coracana subsp. coracana TaxID=191504 RepID=A0AAV5C152_ELECO|nr:hypothetical protein PR202_ga08669 [Eleusine coracana subsp. coracana]